MVAFIIKIVDIIHHRLPKCYRYGTHNRLVTSYLFVTPTLLFETEDDFPLKQILTYMLRRCTQCELYFNYPIKLRSNHPIT